MLVHVPGSLDGLLSLLTPCFTQPTFVLRGVRFGHGRAVVRGDGGVWRSNV